MASLKWEKAGKQGTRCRKSGRRRAYISAAKRRALEDEEKSRRGVDLRLLAEPSGSSTLLHREWWTNRLAPTDTLPTIPPYVLPVPCPPTSRLSKP